MTRLLVLLALALIGTGCGGDETTPPATAPVADAPGATSPAPARVLVVTETAGFRHGSIPAAERALRDLDDAADDYALDFSDLDDWPRVLEDADAVAFVLTSGELPLSAATREALIAFVEEGNGFLGVHSATDTLYEFPRYRDLIGSWFRDHPYREGTLRRVEAEHPATADLPETLAISEELYRFREDPRARGMVPLLELERVAGAPAGGYLPSAWCGRVGDGRTIYTALGHLDTTWNAGWFRDHVDGALGWAAGTRPSGVCG